MKKKDAFDDKVDGPPGGGIESAPEGTPKNALSNLHKDVQEGALKAALIGALKIAL